MRHRRLASLIGIVVLVAILCSCSANASLPANGTSSLPTDYSSSVKVVVTRDFGKQILVEQTVIIGEDTTAMDALRQIAKVNTKYGGGFVSAINGIGSEYEGSSNSKKDWFFYINGISSIVGANDYVLRGGDIEHWDFRDWSYHEFVPAIVGDFPQPFLSGFQGKVRPTIIIYHRGLKEYAQSLAGRLSELGVKEISVQGYDQLTQGDQEHCNLILLGTKDNELISELNDIYTRLGFYAYFSQEKLVALNSKGEVASEYGAGSGLIQATQNPWNPKGVGASENVVWVVSGSDEAGVESAARALIDHQADFKYAHAVVIAEGKVIKLPQ